ncbi:MAG: fumarylacetoacetate hydrolase family protein [Thermomicrobiales bacterium]
MKIVRYADATTGTPAYGIVEGDMVYAAPGDLFGGLTKGDAVGPLADVKVVTPLDPGKVLCIGMNYLKHVTEIDPTRKVPTEPVVFMKPTSAIIGPGETIEIANPQNNTDYEAELVVVVGKTARRVAEADALDYVLGYTSGNDVSDRVLQAKDGQWIRAKGFDTYLPLGPSIVTDLDPANTKVESRVNGETRQSDNTDGLIFNVPFLVSFLSNVMTLDPGDIIMTGTPFGVGPLKDGDVVEVEVGSIGVLSNPVANRA